MDSLLYEFLTRDHNRLDELLDKASANPDVLD